ARWLPTGYSSSSSHAAARGKSSRSLCPANCLMSCGFAMVSLVPSLSASAETIRTNEIPCQGKNRGNWLGTGARRLVALLDPVHGLVVEPEVVADLVNHDIPHEIGHLLGVAAV